MSFSEFLILIEIITTKSPSIIFDELELKLLYEEVCKNRKGNGFLHVCRMFSYEGRIISIPELAHYIKISNTTDLNLIKKIRTQDHLVSIRSTSEEVMACMFTSKSSTNLPGYGESANVRLENNSIKYSTVMIRSSPINFYSYFSIYHDINNFPKSFLTNPSGINLKKIIIDSNLAFNDVFDITLQEKSPLL